MIIQLARSVTLIPLAPQIMPPPANPAPIVLPALVKLATANLATQENNPKPITALPASAAHFPKELKHVQHVLAAPAAIPPMETVPTVKLVTA